MIIVGGWDAIVLWGRRPTLGGGHVEETDVFIGGTGKDEWGAELD